MILFSFLSLELPDGIVDSSDIYLFTGSSIRLGDALLYTLASSQGIS
jgi:hypothetical protein